MIDRLEDNLRRMSKIEPSKGFIKASKNRLMHQIELSKHESWFKAFLKRIGVVQPEAGFLLQARMRLMEQITKVPQSVKIPVYGFARTMLILKRAVASTMVMMLAVTSTLFVVEGNTVVEASDDSYLEVLTGSATIKHADFLLWEDINGQIEVQAGDLIRVAAGSQAVLHFFDDTQLRLAENSTLLINQLAISPSFSRQGIIEVALHQGAAWVQTLNVEDGYSSFILSTRDALVTALRSSFSVQTQQNEPTDILVLNNRVELNILQADTRESLSSVKLSANEKVRIYAATSNSKPQVTTGTIAEQDLATVWVQQNLSRDAQHMAQLREREIEHLTQMAGTLPGEMLYPIKQAKERLRLLVSGNNANKAVQIQMANNRLSEAIVLLESGETQKGREALMAYQSIARQLAESANSSNQFAHKLITPYQKAIVSTTDLPNEAAIGLVKDALHETAEILATDKIELERVRLVNSVDRLRDVLRLVEIADFVSARDRLVSHELIGGDMLAVIEGLDGELQKHLAQEVLELRQEEVALLSTITEKMAAIKNSDQQLAAMLASATDQAIENVDETLAFAAPIIPEAVAAVVDGPSATQLKIAELIERIYIYKTPDGQRNQVARLFKYELENPASIAYLTQVLSALEEGAAQDYLNEKIAELEEKASFQKHKAVQRKIERTQRLREI